MKQSAHCNLYRLSITDCAFPIGCSFWLFFHKALIKGKPHPRVLAAYTTRLFISKHIILLAYSEIFVPLTLVPLGFLDIEGYAISGLRVRKKDNDLAGVLPEDHCV